LLPPFETPALRACSGLLDGDIDFEPRKYLDVSDMRFLQKASSSSTIAAAIDTATAPWADQFERHVR
jgi:hypothetical protein